MIATLLLGISYGFTAGISPGALLGLVIKPDVTAWLESWQYGSVGTAKDIAHGKMRILLESKHAYINEIASHWRSMSMKLPFLYDKATFQAE